MYTFITSEQDPDTAMCWDICISILSLYKEHPNNYVDEHDTFKNRQYLQIQRI